jgi:hypothetical protein
VKYAQRLATSTGDQYAQLGSFPAVVQHIRRRPFQPDDGTAQKGVRACVPIQRARMWPHTFNCFEATAHALGAFLHWNLIAHWDFHVFDRNLGPRTRHVWPVVVDPVRVQGWIIVLDSVVPRQHGQIMANDWYNDVLGGVHKVGRVVLKLYGLDSVGEASEKAWGNNLPKWARDEKKKDAPTNEKNKKRNALPE